MYFGKICGGDSLLDQLMLLIRSVKFRVKNGQSGISSMPISPPIPETTIMHAFCEIPPCIQDNISSRPLLSMLLSRNGQDIAQ